MCNIFEVADAAEMIINGYAFTKKGDNVKVLNLNKPEKQKVYKEMYMKWSQKSDNGFYGE